MKTWLFVCWLVLGSHVALAGPASDHVKAKYTAVSKLVEKPTPNDTRIDKAIDGLFDYDAMVEGMFRARSATRKGKSWSSSSRSW